MQSVTAQVAIAIAVPLAIHSTVNAIKRKMTTRSSARLQARPESTRHPLAEIDDNVAPTKPKSRKQAPKSSAGKKARKPPHSKVARKRANSKARLIQDADASLRTASVTLPDANEVLRAIITRRRTASMFEPGADVAAPPAVSKPASSRRRVPKITEDDDNAEPEDADERDSTMSSQKGLLPNGQPMFLPPSSGEQRDIEAREVERQKASARRQAKRKPKSPTSHKQPLQDEESTVAEDADDDRGVFQSVDRVVAPTSERTIRSLLPSSTMLRRSARPRSGRGRAGAREDTPYPQRHETPPPVTLTSHHVGYTPARVVAELDATVSPTANCPPRLVGKPKSALKRTHSEAQIDVANEEHDKLASELFPVPCGTLTKRVRLHISPSEQRFDPHVPLSCEDRPKAPRTSDAHLGDAILNDEELEVMIAEPVIPNASPVKDPSHNNRSRRSPRSKTNLPKRHSTSTPNPPVHRAIDLLHRAEGSKAPNFAQKAVTEPVKPARPPVSRADESRIGSLRARTLLPRLRSGTGLDERPLMHPVSPNSRMKQVPGTKRQRLELRNDESDKSDEEQVSRKKRKPTPSYKAAVGKRHEEAKVHRSSDAALQPVQRGSPNKAAATFRDAMPAPVLRAPNGKLVRCGLLPPTSVADTNTSASSIGAHVPRRPTEAAPSADRAPHDGAKYAMLVRLLEELVDEQDLREEDLEAANTLLGLGEERLSAAKPSSTIDRASHPIAQNLGDAISTTRGIPRSSHLHVKYNERAPSDDGAIMKASNANVGSTSSLTSIDDVDEEPRQPRRPPVVIDSDSANPITPPIDAQMATDDDIAESESARALSLPLTIVKQPQQGRTLTCPGCDPITRGISAEGSSSCFHCRPNKAENASTTLRRRSKPDIDQWLSDVVSEHQSRNATADAPQPRSIAIAEPDDSESELASVRRPTTVKSHARPPESSRDRSTKTLVPLQTNAAKSTTVLTAKIPSSDASNDAFTINEHCALPATKPVPRAVLPQPSQPLIASRDTRIRDTRRTHEPTQYAAEISSARTMRNTGLQRDSFDTPSTRPAYKYPDRSHHMEVDSDAAHRMRGVNHSAVTHEAPPMPEATYPALSPAFERELSTESYLELPPPLNDHFDEGHRRTDRGNGVVASTKHVGTRRRDVFSDIQTGIPDVYHRYTGPISRHIPEYDHNRNTALHGIGSDGIPVIRTAPQRSEQRDPLQPLLGGANAAALHNLHSMNQHAAQQSVGKAGPQLMKPLSRDVAPPIRRPGTAMQTISGQRMPACRKSSRIEAIKAMKNVRVGGIGI